MEKLPSAYPASELEPEIYHLWEKSGYFNPDKLPGERKEPFTIIMPPPNANDPLHIGHAVFVSLQDIMIRYQRMRGKRTLWLPGTDHAGFETQVVWEKKLAQQGKDRFSLGREEFFRQLWEYTQKNKRIVKEQLKSLGASCDWSREKFTLDEDIVSIVYETFYQLWKDGLLYRGKRIVNYCPYHRTAFSNLEVKYTEEKTYLYFVRYDFADNSGEYITVATTRPETIPGDVAIAVNPKDRRYSSVLGREVIEPITKRKIPIIADERVEMDFGTGALKITPAHASLDFEIGQDHHLDIRETLDFDGKFNKLAGPLAGLTVSQARKKAEEILQSGGYLVKKQEYWHQIGRCYKCGTAIEPMLMDQWFVAVTKPFRGGKSLRDLAVEAVQTGKIKIIPSRFKKVFFHWMENLRDWNISRQIVWGIRIPVYYCQEQKSELCHKKKGIIVSPSGPPARCPYCGSTKIKQDPDVLDTWFSSGQWPFATLMTTGENDFSRFYPTQVMETGWDILFFWVARMIMLGLYRTKKVPFEVVYLHGLVRDKDRQKMSKSKGNVIDPLGVVNTYGADALRMALVIGNTAGKDIIIFEEKIKGYRNFANKIWNVARFVLLNLEGFNPEKGIELISEDKKILQEFNSVKKKVTQHLDNYRFSLAGETLYQYFWHTFADKIVEEMKIRIKGKNQVASAQYVLYSVLTDCLKMLHPFMPFVTEAIWQRLPKSSSAAQLLMVEKWPL